MPALPIVAPRCESIRSVRTIETIDGQLVDERADDGRCVMISSHGGIHIFDNEINPQHPIVRRWQGTAAA